MGKIASLGVIGLGNMGTALVEGAIRAGVLAPRAILGFDREPAKNEIAMSRTGIRVAERAEDVFDECDAVLVAVKPQNFGELATLDAARRARCLVVSICAGIGLDAIAAAFPNARHARVMPNTPALVGKGMSAIAFAASADDDDRQFVKSLFAGVGRVVEVSDEDMDAVTAVSGSGPAFFFRFARALARAGAAVGLDEPLALELAVQTGLGAMTLARSSARSLDELIQQVSSPGGTTVAGLAALDDAGFDEAVRRCVEAAYRRSRELGGRS